MVAEMIFVSIVIFALRFLPIAEFSIAREPRVLSAERLQMRYRCRKHVKLSDYGDDE